MGEALEVLAQARGRLDLVMLDVVMADGDGVKLARQIQEEWPDQRVLFMSGFAAEVLARYGLKELDVPFLAKPFTRSELLAKVRETLQRPHAGADANQSGDEAERRMSEGPGQTARASLVARFRSVAAHEGGDHGSAQPPDGGARLASSTPRTAPSRSAISNGLATNGPGRVRVPG